MSSPLHRRSPSLLSSTPSRPRWIAVLRGGAALTLAAASLALYGCPGSIDPALMGTGGTGNTGGGSGVCDAPTMVLQSTDQLKGCGSDASCHGATLKESGLDLVSPGVIGRLLGKMPDPTTSLSCMSSTMPYLMAGSNPAQGLIIDKLNSTPSCGLTMPYPLGNLPAAQRTCLMEWATAVTTGQITQ
jgi:hypothetical protein